MTRMTKEKEKKRKKEDVCRDSNHCAFQPTQGTAYQMIDSCWWSVCLLVQI